MSYWHPPRPVSFDGLSENPAAMVEVLACARPGAGALLGGRRNPAEQPASEVDPHDRAALVAGEEAALPLQTAAGDDVLVAVAGQQADLGRRVVRGQFAVRRRTDLRLDAGPRASSLPHQWRW